MTQQATYDAADELGSRAGEIGSTERWCSAATGAALVIAGWHRRSAAGGVAAGVGGWLLWRAWRGQSPIYRALGVTHHPASSPGEVEGQVVHGRAGVTIDAPAQDVYRRLRDFSSLPELVPGIASVDQAGDQVRMVFNMPAGRETAIEGVILDERPGEGFAWEATNADTGVRVSIRPAPADRGTEVRLVFWYRPAFGAAGALAAKLSSLDPQHQARLFLLRLKQSAEAGEIATSAGPRGG